MATSSKGKASKLNYSRTSDRIMTFVPQPRTQLLTESDLYSGNANLPKLKHIREHLINEGKLEKGAAVNLLRKGANILREERNLLKLSSPINIVGDIHGQFYDLMKLFSEFGEPPTQKYLFLGDYVDRGMFGIECILYLWCLKIHYPSHIYLLRGNHETREMTKYFTYKKECLVKYGEEVYQASMMAFDCLPIAAVVDDQLFCVHGGICPEIMKVEALSGISRFLEPNRVSRLILNMLWSDPHPSFDKPEGLFYPNHVRGCSYYYTFGAVQKFLDNNGLNTLVRAHEVFPFGYHQYKDSNKGFPSVVTLFSAPNYCDVYKNIGAILQYANSTMTFKQFNASPHPYCLPNFIDGLTWSIPYTCLYVTSMLQAILNYNMGDDNENMDENMDEKCVRIRNKIATIGKLAVVYKKMKKERDAALHLKGIMPCASITGQSSKYETVNNFNQAKALDTKNELAPESIRVMT